MQKTAARSKPLPTGQSARRPAALVSSIAAKCHLPASADRDLFPILSTGGRWSRRPRHGRSAHAARSGPGFAHSRYAPEVERAYANDRIEVTWEPAFCIHVAECLRGLPAVFDNQRRPWIIVDNGSPGDIGEVIQRCPTGALHFRRVDGGPQEPVPEATTIQERPNGPLFVRGNVRIFSQDHTLVRQDTRVALCRCGASANKPFCDGSHRRVGFRTG